MCLNHSYYLDQHASFYQQDKLIDVMQVINCKTILSTEAYSTQKSTDFFSLISLILSIQSLMEHRSQANTSVSCQSFSCITATHALRSQPFLSHTSVVWHLLTAFPHKAAVASALLSTLVSPSHTTCLQASHVHHHSWHSTITILTFTTHHTLITFPYIQRIKIIPTAKLGYIPNWTWTCVINQSQNGKQLSCSISSIPYCQSNFSSFDPLGQGLQLNM